MLRNTSMNVGIAEIMIGKRRRFPGPILNIRCICIGQRALVTLLDGLLLQHEHVSSEMWTKNNPPYESIFFLFKQKIPAVCKKFCIFPWGLSYRCIQYNTTPNTVCSHLQTLLRYFNIRHCFLYHNKSTIFWYITDLSRAHLPVRQEKYFFFPLCKWRTV